MICPDGFNFSSNSFYRPPVNKDYMPIKTNHLHIPRNVYTGIYSLLLNLYKEIPWCVYIFFILDLRSLSIMSIFVVSLYFEIWAGLPQGICGVVIREWWLDTDCAT